MKFIEYPRLAVEWRRRNRKRIHPLALETRRGDMP